MAARRSTRHRGREVRGTEAGQPCAATGTQRASHDTKASRPGAAQRSDRHRNEPAIGSPTSKRYRGVSTLATQRRQTHRVCGECGRSGQQTKPRKPATAGRHQHRGELRRADSHDEWLSRGNPGTLNAARGSVTRSASRGPTTSEAAPPRPRSRGNTQANALSPRHAAKSTPAPRREAPRARAASWHYRQRRDTEPATPSSPTVNRKSRTTGGDWRGSEAPCGSHASDPYRCRPSRCPRCRASARAPSPTGR